MKTKQITQKEADFLEASTQGPLMVYKPMTAEEEKQLGEWVAQRKLALKAKKPKTLLQKIFS